ncbi:hypothetical protein COU62_03310 [Candidatus Pacearchaeota archaeon CG10_big_fil_rev_8_21_14_0_10_35_219]|nr:MAG: hypothetical protein AUJ63_03855 [Candidatus Pacearchaeota archaeon CG1_02_35_32]PIO07382.1 MAG: hypothetical protein COU62_03310 [Candidatus Pacearchaeota archaeon CG10_big_fil_rev_8_21_14_0_10_35_219]PIY81689.1 MAG: hypothetical protein COY79_01285 [Candidatus Pacearchaeota archaeon CG_4_10_14_0_8_um_filter_35_169]PIZ79507.1 MAG: hypothetical protein COY00_03750 [Candidatus Pacearchaeota archaeon CG_4_10_14_0_2_um_filter_35_33]PJA69889.1 MAG: hypothetical protein CO155_02805 [Candidat
MPIGKAFRTNEYAIRKNIFEFYKIKKFLCFTPLKCGVCLNFWMLKVAFIHALKYMVFCIGNLDIKISAWLKKYFRVEDNYTKARLSEFYAKKKGKKLVVYGVVVGIYSPDFRKAVINKTDMAQESVLTECLEKRGFFTRKRFGKE